MADDLWRLAEDGFGAEDFKTFEGLFTLGSGYLHVRGSLEELLAGEPQDQLATGAPGETLVHPLTKAGTYVPGLMGICDGARRMINLPFFLDVRISHGEETLDMRRSRTARYRRSLDLKRALLTRETAWQPQAGGEVTLVFERFVSAARPHLCFQRISLTANENMTIGLTAGILGEVTTDNAELTSGIAFAFLSPGRISCTVETTLGEQVFMETRLTGPAGIAWTGRQAGRNAECRAEIPLRPGKTVVIEKRTAVATSRDLVQVQAAAVLDEASACSFEDLLSEHATEWAARWAACDVVIEGDDESQLDLRHQLYQLERSIVRDDPRLAIEAKGYAGEVYRGLFFWDTEMFLLPYYLYTNPALARNLCDHRLHALPGARKVAASYGYGGARYPWMSDADGNECCEPWLFKEQQLHVTADVVYGFAHYAAATGQADYLDKQAGEAILATARYWAERVDRRSGDADHVHLLGVMGPDEFTAMTSNSSYTNRLVRFALERAVEVGATHDASPEELARFAWIARALPMPRRADGLVLQCEEFDGLAEKDIQALWKNRSIPFEWQIPRETIHRAKIIKQADVLMLMMLFPGEYTDAEVRQAWDYYLPMTTHDSSLSPGIHALVALRLGLDEIAWTFWRRTIGLDRRPGHGGAREGIHIACCGASWMMAVLGFAGMKTALQSDILAFKPHLPAAWRRLAFPVVWQGQPVQVEITRDAVTVENRSPAPLAVRVGTLTRTIPPQGRQAFVVPS